MKRVAEELINFQKKRRNGVKQVFTTSLAQEGFVSAVGFRAKGVQQE